MGALLGGTLRPMLRSSLAVLVIATTWVVPSGAAAPKAPASAAPAVAKLPKVTMMPLTLADGLEPKAGALLTDTIVAHMRRLPGLEVVSLDDVRAVLSHEQQKQLLGCREGECLAELGGALGCDELVTGSVGRLGRSWILHLRRVEVTKASVAKQVDRRVKDGTVDDLLDVLPSLVGELFDRAPPEDRTEVSASQLAKPLGPGETNCDEACAHVLACKGRYQDADLAALTGEEECLETCAAGIALGQEPTPWTRGKRALGWVCATAATSCLELDKRCDVY